MDVSDPRETSANLLYFTATKETFMKTLSHRPPGDLFIHNSHWTRTSEWWWQSVQLWETQAEPKPPWNLVSLKEQSLMEKKKNLPNLTLWYGDCAQRKSLLRGSQSAVVLTLLEIWEFENCRHLKISLRNTLKVCPGKRSSLFTGLSVYKSCFLREFYHKLSLRDADVLLLLKKTQVWRHRNTPGMQV